MGDYLDFMKEALIEANKAVQFGETPIGAVVVKDQKIIARSHNQRETDQIVTAHAEILVIQEACSKLNSWRLSGCSIYVTLEPCPMCMGAIIAARIENLYFGAWDKKAGACGSVLNLNDYPFNHKVNIYEGINADSCSAVLTEFFKNLRNN